MASTTKRIVPRPGYKIVFVAYITTKDGRFCMPETMGSAPSQSKCLSNSGQTTSAR